VEFEGPPQKQPWDIYAMFKDSEEIGSFFRLTENTRGVWHKRVINFGGHRLSRTYDATEKWRLTQTPYSFRRSEPAATKDLRADTAASTTRYFLPARV
jgi:hypothetical protein